MEGMFGEICLRVGKVNRTEDEVLICDRAWKR